MLYCFAFCGINKMVYTIQCLSLIAETRIDGIMTYFSIRDLFPLGKSESLSQKKTSCYTESREPACL